MKIIFDLRKVGLGDNGGSSTLIHSGNTLVDMGNEVYFIDSMRNQHTWTKLNAKHIRVNKESDIPDADAIIATGYKSVGSTIKAPDRCGMKFHWIRAWETWQMDESRIVKKVLAAPLIKLVNSICLQKKLKHFDVPSHIIRPGYDFSQIYPKHIRGKKEQVIIGGLYREGVHGRRKRTGWLYETARKLKTRNRHLQFWLFGSEKPPNDFLHDKYMRSPSIDLKNEFYNSVDIWMAPTMSEGLHLPPAEAMMTECPVVTTDAELSGTQDYTINYETGIVSNDNLKDFIECVNLLVEDEKLRIRLGKAARKKILALGDRKENMQKMIDLFMELKNENI